MKAVPEDQAAHSFFNTIDSGVKILKEVIVFAQTVRLLLNRQKIMWRAQSQSVQTTEIKLMPVIYFNSTLACLPTLSKNR